MKFNINKLLKLKIRSKLVIAFTALSLLPVLIVGSIGITTNIKSLRQISINNLDHDLMEIKKDLDLFFYGIEDKIFFLISSLSFQHLTEAINEDDKNKSDNSIQEILQEIKAFTRKKEIFYQIKFIKNNGDEVFILEKRNDEYQLLPEEQLNKSRSKFYLYITKNIPPNSAVFIPIEIIAHDQKSLIPAISCVYRIETNNFSGILVFQIYAQSFFKIVNKKNPVISKGKVMLVNSDGYYTYRSDRQSDWNKLSATRDSRNLINDFGNETANKILNKSTKEVFEIDSVIIARADVFTSGIGLGNKFTILKTVAKSDIFEPVENFNLLFWGLLALFTILPIYLAFKATQQFIIPIKKLRNEVEVIADGRYASRVNIKTYDEMEELAHQFNKMAESLEQNEAEKAQQQKLLEFKVQDRTKDLESEKNKLQIIFDNLPSGFIQLDKSGKIKSTSAYMKVISGKKTSELIGQSCFDILSCCKKYGKCRAKELFQKGVFKSSLKKFFSETEDSVFEHTLVPIKKEGNIDSILEIITDITESKRLQDHLIRSEKLATTGEMSAIVAHEIRNSLTSVRMILQLLSRSGTLTIADKESYDVALNSIARMENVVEDLLKIARPAKLEKKPTKINDVFVESLKLAEHQILSKEIVIIVDSDKEIPEILLDPVRLKEAFINLILNASQAIEEFGKISISSKMVKLDKDLHDLGEIIIDGDSPKVNLQKIILRKGSPVLRIDISDNGCGISHENKERIFDPFFTTKVNGTGLGLSLVKRVINQHRGIITVDSQVGNGCKFSIYIPNTF